MRYEVKSGKEDTMECMRSVRVRIMTKREKKEKIGF